jgi:ankyrin repeat protein
LGHLDVVRLLLENDARPCCQNSRHLTPLDLAAAVGPGWSHRGGPFAKIVDLLRPHYPSDYVIKPLTEDDITYYEGTDH